MRATYIDNNGFERYEDTTKRVVKKVYDNSIANEIYSTFKNNNHNSIIYGDYEGKILAKQEYISQE